MYRSIVILPLLAALLFPRNAQTSEKKIIYPINNISHSQATVIHKIPNHDGLRYYNSLGMNRANNDLAIFVGHNANRFKRINKGYAKLDLFCKGDGVTDDTEGFQKAVNTGLNITSSPGKVYLIGTIRATTPWQIFILYGCKLKFKDNQTSGSMLVLNGIHEEVRGGTFDGNKDNQHVDAITEYNYAAVLLDADYTAAIGVTSVNSAGIGVKSNGKANYIKTDSCKISGFQLDGVFYDGSHSTALIGNIISNNYIDGTNVPGTTGIHINSFYGKDKAGNRTTNLFQTNWTISGNTVKIKNVSKTDQGSAISQRGKNGLCTNNKLYGGIFAITEGGPNATISNNICIADTLWGHGTALALAGIECHYNNNVIENNYVEGFKYSLMSSKFEVSSNVKIQSNNFKNWVTASIYFNANTIPARGISISNNIFEQGKNKTPALYLQNDVQNVNINGGNARGIGGMAVLLDNTGGEINVSNVSFKGYSNVVSCYSATNKVFNHVILDSISSDRAKTNNILVSSLAKIGVGCNETHTKLSVR